MGLFSSRQDTGDPCGDPPLHVPTPEETFADLIKADRDRWDRLSLEPGR